jgi:hypothetical protein
MPGGLLETLPLPVPERVTVSVKEVPVPLKVAVTARSAVICRVQVAPVHAPAQPANVDPPAGVAVSVTWVPLG